MIQGYLETHFFDHPWLEFPPSDHSWSQAGVSRGWTPLEPGVNMRRKWYRHPWNHDEYRTCSSFNGPLPCEDIQICGGGTLYNVGMYESLSESFNIMIYIFISTKIGTLARAAQACQWILYYFLLLCKVIHWLIPIQHRSSTTQIWLLKSTTGWHHCLRSSFPGQKNCLIATKLSRSRIPFTQESLWTLQVTSVHTTIHYDPCTCTFICEKNVWSWDGRDKKMWSYYIKKKKRLFPAAGCSYLRLHQENPSG